MGLVWGSSAAPTAATCAARISEGTDFSTLSDGSAFRRPHPWPKTVAEFGRRW
jgi:hypothetical protein